MLLYEAMKILAFLLVFLIFKRRLRFNGRDKPAVAGSATRSGAGNPDNLAGMID